MSVNLSSLESPAVFERFCQALLAKRFSRFQAFSQPDLGMDGYDSDSGTVFQVYFPERSPRKDKIAADLSKAQHHSWPCTHWVLLIPKNPTPDLLTWLQKKQKSLPFTVEIWGQTSICKMLEDYSALRDEYFPTELKKELRRLAKGKRPKHGDATTEPTITPTQAAEIKQQIEKLAEESAARKKRKATGADYMREYGEFKSYFSLSSYDRLPASNFFKACEYLERKLYGRRSADTNAQERHRYVGGIKGIQKKLGISDSKYRSLLVQFAGVSSTTRMELKDLKRVFENFKQMQGEADAQS